MMRLTTRSAPETEAVGAALGARLHPGDLVVLTGDLGAGKTTIAKGIARGLGVTEPVTSPTFTIVQEYEGRCPVAHVDVYRLERLQELHDFGFDELLESHVVLVEWGGAITRLLPADRCEVELTLDAADDAVRRVEITAIGPGWSTRRAELDDALAAVAPTAGTA